MKPVHRSEGLAAGERFQTGVCCPLPPAGVSAGSDICLGSTSSPELHLYSGMQAQSPQADSVRRDTQDWVRLCEEFFNRQLCPQNHRTSCFSLVRLL